MLGNTIRDSQNVESKNSESTGLGLFDFETTFESEKRTRQVELTTVESSIFNAGLTCQGYEIHMGRTTFKTSYFSLFSSPEDENPMNFGIINKGGTVLGNYLHVFFDNNLFRQKLLCYIREQRNVDKPPKPFDFTQFRQNELDRLCDLLTDSVNMKEVSNIIGV